MRGHRFRGWLGQLAFMLFAACSMACCMTGSVHAAATGAIPGFDAVKDDPEAFAQYVTQHGSNVSDEEFVRLVTHASDQDWQESLGVLEKEIFYRGVFYENLVGLQDLGLVYITYDPEDIPQNCYMHTLAAQLSAGSFERLNSLSVINRAYGENVLDTTYIDVLRRIMHLPTIKNVQVNGFDASQLDGLFENGQPIQRLEVFQSGAMSTEEDVDQKVAQVVSRLTHLSELDLTGIITPEAGEILLQLPKLRSLTVSCTKEDVPQLYEMFRKNDPTFCLNLCDRDSPGRFTKHVGERSAMQDEAQ